jgi:hypothetical protein
VLVADSASGTLPSADPDAHSFPAPSRDSQVVEGSVPSEHVRDVVRERFKIPDEKLPVIYPGGSPLFRPINEEEKRTRLEQKYGIRFPNLMFCGRWEKRKNIIGTLKAFHLFKRGSKTERRLVLSGGRRWHTFEAESIIRRLGMQNDIFGSRPGVIV